MRTRLVAAVAMTVLLLCGGVFGETPTAKAQRELFAAINEARRSNRLPALRWDESLAIAAQRHAEVMMEHGETQHAFAGEPSLSARARQAGAHFTWLSENVDRGPSAGFIQAQFMHSGAHRANILDQDMNSVGIGVVERGGEFFAVEDFSQAR